MNREQRRRTAGYRQPARTRYVGRGTPWGNPYPVDTYGRAVALELYRAHARHMLAANPQWLEPLRDYEHLSCYCPQSEPCHVDVAARAARQPMNLPKSVF